MDRKYRIAWLPGDGVGKEVMEAARIVLDRAGLDADYVHGDIGWEFWRSEGDAFPARTIDLLNDVDAAMFGAITSKPVKETEKELIPELQGKGLKYRSPIVRMRANSFDLYVCLRPCKAYPENPINFHEGIDLVIFRENTEDLYAGVEFNPVPDKLRDVLSELAPAFKAFDGLPGDHYAVSCKINTRKGSERIIRAAFEFARKFGRKKVTAVHKANVVRATDGPVPGGGRARWQRTSRTSPWTMPTSTLLPCGCSRTRSTTKCWWHPTSMETLFPISAPKWLAGSDSAAPEISARSSPCFEPTHGSAPKYSGQYKVNPIATILAAKMMLDWLGETEAAQRVEDAVGAVVREGEVQTYDMGGSATTLEMAEAIADRL